jgi:5'-methylthioadenosine phosphorylase
MPQAKIGIIGGSGLYEMEGLKNIKEFNPKTPFGEPSDTIIVGELQDKKIAFLPRHGRGHFINPTDIPVRANIYALKSLGVEWLISVNAVGSLKENIHPLDIVIPDQIIDRTKSRVNTFFDKGIVAHPLFADPFCSPLSQLLYKAAKEIGAKVHKGGTYVVIEGPFFSTRAESNVYRSWRTDVIGMTVLPEAKLAREAEMCYSSLSCVTDYDCWHETEESVTIEMVLENLKHNVETAKRIIELVTERIPESRGCPCADALQNAIITSPEKIPVKMKRDLALLIGKYIK